MLGRSIGLSNEEMAELGHWESSRLFDQTDKLVLRFTDQLSRENRVDDDLFGELSARFSQPELLKLTFTIGMAGIVNRVHATFLTDVDEATLGSVGDTVFCPLPEPASGAS